MNPKRRKSVDEASFEGLIDFGSIPPPTSGPSAVDVHAARTAVAELPKGLLEELRKGKGADPQVTVERRKFEVPADASPFGEEAPTTPGKERNQDLLAAVNAALAAAGAGALQATTQPPPAEAVAATPEATASAPPPPAFAFPPPVEVQPRASSRRRRRALILALIAVVLTVIAIFAARRFVHRHA